MLELNLRRDAFSDHFVCKRTITVGLLGKNHLKAGMRLRCIKILNQLALILGRSQFEVVFIYAWLVLL